MVKEILSTSITWIVIIITAINYSYLDDSGKVHVLNGLILLNVILDRFYQRKDEREKQPEPVVFMNGVAIKGPR